MRLRVISLPFRTTGCLFCRGTNVTLDMKVTDTPFHIQGDEKSQKKQESRRMWDVYSGRPTVLARAGDIFCWYLG